MAHAIGVFFHGLGKVMKWSLITIAFIVVVSVIATMASSSGSAVDNSQPVVQPNVHKVQPNPQQVTPSEVQAPSTGQAQALQSAQDYLSLDSGFSQSSLSDQLKYEGFSGSDRSWAINQAHPDWNQQAVLSAQGYMDMGGFSRSSLSEQLAYEGFTPAQVQYALSVAY